ncbi:DNA repair protein RecN (Recombination protein N) [Paenibacillus endophyticus]|uniref:DNA repair protein RecN n=1 Tax=Paenibacillus endophyticus TaxID=1294268 RepID=A0A7W5CB63_9BACL|nr:DNA repair protein RecN [Paenibacillus endophyticus]MBB3154503.1 DNA repair protein RecN (Recombination protein N) [Paenibacillus endophyticus]
MLREMSIRNLAVIEEVNVTFHHGFHVLTGETGAGKSILIDALSLLVGGRGSADMVRYGCDKAEMEALFDLPSIHPVWQVLNRLGVHAVHEEMLVIRRELSAHGKSSSRVNGQLVTMTMLREIGECLVNIHGQHEHQSLLRSEQHLEWLDLFAGDLLIERKQNYRTVFSGLQQVRASLRDLENATRHNVQMLDLYRFQIEEITAAQLKVDEDESLTELRRKLMYAGKRMDAVSDAYDLLYGGKGLDMVSKAVAKLIDIQSYDPAKLNPLLEQLQSAFYQAEDAAFQLRDYRDGIESDPDQLSQVEDRLDLINGLKRKYGETIPDILAYLDRTMMDRDKIENRDQLLEELRVKEAKLYDQSLVLAQELSQLRGHAAAKLSEAIENELGQLQMPSARFRVQIDATVSGSGDTKQIRLHTNGMDEAIFMLSTNPGEPLKQLSKIASGGEMSRIMLALKSIFAEIDQVPVLIFDEVDTGVSGRAAQAIAEKMSQLALKCQVFSITHLPQVACMADHHYEIRKQVIGARTSTSVTELLDQVRIDELARMLGGVEVTEKTRHHAQEMLDLAVRQKGA